MDTQEWRRNAFRKKIGEHNQTFCSICAIHKCNYSFSGATYLCAPRSLEHLLDEKQHTTTFEDWRSADYVQPNFRMIKMMRKLPFIPDPMSHIFIDIGHNTKNGASQLFGSIKHLGLFAEQDKQRIFGLVRSIINRNEMCSNKLTFSKHWDKFFIFKNIQLDQAPAILVCFHNCEF